MCNDGKFKSSYLNFLIMSLDSRSTGLSPSDILRKLTLSVRKAAAKAIKAEEAEETGFKSFDPDVQNLEFKTLYDR